MSWLIPARAGNTPRTSAESPPTPAHPRSRGEHSRKPAIDRLVIGSSPLARGTLARRCISSATTRLIPARAGNTGVVRILAIQAAAHPRSRGEHHGSASSFVRHLGSSPLARGTRSRLAGLSRKPWLIPARAGNTRSSRLPMLRRAAHPRSRGEHALIRFASYCALGSSPLARGTLRGCCASCTHARLIPARAGNT